MILAARLCLAASLAGLLALSAEAAEIERDATPATLERSRADTAVRREDSAAAARRSADDADIGRATDAGRADRDSGDTTVRQLPQRELPPAMPEEAAQDRGAAVDTTGLWFHLRREDLAAVDREMERLRANHPDWVMPAELVAAIRRLAVQKALAEGRYAAVIEAAENTPEQFGCTAPANAWGLAEALHRSGRSDAALQAYLDLAADCTASDMRLASVQKAWAVAQDEAQRDRVRAQLAALQPLPGARRFAEQIARGDGAGRVWSALEEADYPTARRALEAARDADPSFRADADLQGGLADLALRTAIRERRPGGLTAARRAYPLAFGCGNLARHWALADGYGRLGWWRQRARTYVELARDCGSERVALASLQKLSQGGPAAVEHALAALPDRPGAPWQVWRAQRQRDRLIAQLEPGAPSAAASRAAQVLPDLARQARDPAAAEALGWAALRRDAPETALDWFRRAVRWGGAPTARRGELLSLAATDRVADMQSVLAGRPDLRRDPAVRDAIGAAHARRAARLFDEGAEEQARAEIDRAVALAGPGAWTVLGFAALDAARAEQALEFFRKAPPGPDRAYGIAAALLADARTDAAVAAACPPDLERRPRRWHALCADAMTARLAQLNREDRFPEAAALIDRSEGLGLDQPRLAVLAGWTAMGQDDPVLARDRFRAALQADPLRDIAGMSANAGRGARGDRRQDAANGLVASYAATDDLSALAADPMAQDPQVGRALRTARAEQARRRGLYLAAATVAPANPERDAGPRPPTLSLGGYYRQQAGSPGRDRISASHVVGGGTATFGRTRLGVTADRVEMHIGTPSPGDPVGSATAAWRFPATDGGSLLVPRVTLRHEGWDWALTAALGSTPLGGEVGAAPVGRIGATFYRGPVILSAALFSRSRWNSLLSLSGLRDPVSGSRWGRVRESGARVQATVLASDRIALSAGALLSRLTGEGVADNTRMAANASASYDVRPEGFEFFRVGPYLSAERYRRNLSHFTLGHGGYFSPDSYLSLGGQVAARTLEGGDWLLEGRARLGWSWQSEERAPRFPLAEDGTFFAGQERAGISGDLGLRGAVRLGTRWRLGAMARYSHAREYNDASVGLRLTYSFGAPGGLTAEDLPDIPRIAR